jgi:hypothetical protein
MIAQAFIGFFFVLVASGASVLLWEARKRRRERQRQRLMDRWLRQQVEGPEGRRWAHGRWR